MGVSFDGGLKNRHLGDLGLGEGILPPSMEDPLILSRTISSVETGIARAIERAPNLELDPSPEAAGLAFHLSIQAVASQLEHPQLRPEFTEVFAETTALASIARHTLGAEPLTAEEAVVFLDWITRFFDGWVEP